MRASPGRGDPAVGGAGGASAEATTIETARTMMPGWDIYALEADWRALWHRSGRPPLRSPDAAFIGWLKKRGRLSEVPCELFSLDRDIFSCDFSHDLVTIASAS